MQIHYLPTLLICVSIDGIETISVSRSTDYLETESSSVIRKSEL